MKVLKQVKAQRNLIVQHLRGYHASEISNSQNYVDLRSDTVTRPSQKMREAMRTCPVGDDCYQDDPTVNQLQVEYAKLFGKQDSLFVPSGTMSNLIGMMLHVRQKGEGAIVGSESHVYCIERGGMSALGGIHPIVVKNDIDGTMDLNEIKLAIPPESEHLSQPRLITLESSHNICNGNVLSLEYINQVRQIANQHKIKLHLDGARALNATVYLNVEPSEMVKDFDTVNFCLSKGMGCPIGSLIIGSHEDIKFARILRKLLGGQQRQVGIMASCGLIALEDWKEKLREDNNNAKFTADLLREIPEIDVLAKEVQTNIFRFALKPDYKKFDHGQLTEHLKNEYNILINATFSKDSIRVVTHRDVSRKDLEYFAKSLRDCL